MKGLRGSLVIALLFFIAAQLSTIAAALTGQTFGSLVAAVLMLCFVVAIIRTVVELFREGAAKADAEARKKQPTRS